MTEYIDFWLAKIVVDLAMAGIFLGICGFIYLVIYLYYRFK
jgi:hypothetical protein